ncbi:hypothetical protein M0811_03643 [Anaeramoeba ignava]|uniref:Uncharacterized protein n=1 Tax=Anaeramoeba ignava TaxID=1746090 RepID=A0A9Q0L5S7_ANAIG|nr:hypothetical protein M0811_03643 [Anaeramoeba ignava]
MVNKEGKVIGNIIVNQMLTQTFFLEETQTKETIEFFKGFPELITSTETKIYLQTQKEIKNLKNLVEKLESKYKLITDSKEKLLEFVLELEYQDIFIDDKNQMDNLIIGNFSFKMNDFFNQIEEICSILQKDILFKTIIIYELTNSFERDDLILKLSCWIQNPFFDQEKLKDKISVLDLEIKI